MKLLLALTYYRPHISGLTIFNQRLAEGLANRGHQVTVLTSRYSPDLPQEDWIAGVHVVRLPVRLRLHKGVIMKDYLKTAIRMLRENDIAVINLPCTPLESILLPFLAAAFVRRPVVACYHCDLKLPPGIWNRLINAAVFLYCLPAGLMSDRLITLSEDYGRTSPFLRLFPGRWKAIPPPVTIDIPSYQAISRFRQQHAPGGERLIGIAARFAAEKGIETLAQALPLIEREIPRVKVLFAGEYLNVFGEERIRDHLQPLLHQMASKWSFLGVLAPDEMPSFFGGCDLTVLPSVNRTESFGLVQVESMLCGTPVVASNIPGVRIPVQTSGMGMLAAPKDPNALASAIVEVLRHRERYCISRAKIEHHWSLDRIIGHYEVLFSDLIGKKQVVSNSPDPLTVHLQKATAFRALVRSVECRIIKALGPLEKPVLDLGCGDGVFASVAVPAGVFAGVDPDLKSLTEAKGEKAHQHLIAARAGDLPFSDNSFRTVVANCVLEHIQDIDGALAESARILTSGGLLILSVPSRFFSRMLLVTGILTRMGFARQGLRYARWFHRISRHYHTNGPRIWQARLVSHGFRVLGWDYYLSASSHRVFDLLHYLSIPRLICRRLTGKWTQFSNPMTNFLFDRWLRPYYQDTRPKPGPYLFIHARKEDMCPKPVRPF